ncbi:hypothetical protein P4A93_17965 [Pseudomonas syringae pv. syringae]|uniref:hypothetical protein n=1 Tax=Pseudomonas syringae TaxID=317 RepID=UPI0023F8474F|nr:hypothetical protein [Pseudomonas syringae]MDF5893496.1 hypothetical protein [Pseudomonas syringae pv. syringae]
MEANVWLRGWAGKISSMGWGWQGSGWLVLRRSKHRFAPVAERYLEAILVDTFLRRLTVHDLGMSIFKDRIREGEMKSPAAGWASIYQGSLEIVYLGLPFPTVLALTPIVNV